MTESISMLPNVIRQQSQAVLIHLVGWLRFAQSISRCGVLPALLSRSTHATWCRMTRFGFNSLWAGMLFFAATRAVSFADTKADAPDFQEVYQLIRTHLPGLSEAELNRAAVQGLVSALAPKVTLGTNQISNGA